MNDYSVIKKPKRNLSEIESHYSNSLPLNPQSSDISGISGPNLSKQLAQRRNAIKINMNKFPSDFFVRIEQGMKKESRNNGKDSQNYSQKNKNKITSTHFFNKNKQSREGEGSQFYGKTQSQRNHISPQKTSFFGFFDDKVHNNRKAQVSQIQRETGVKFHTKSKSMSQNKEGKRIGDTNQQTQQIQIYKNSTRNLDQDQSSGIKKNKYKMAYGNQNKFFNQQKLQQRLYKRNYQTRQISKRQPMIKGQALQQLHRHYTPATVFNSQRERQKQKSDLLDLFPATYDQNIKELIINSNRGKAMQIISNPENFGKDQMLSLSQEQHKQQEGYTIVHSISKRGDTIERESQIKRKQKKKSVQTNVGKLQFDKRKKLSMRQKQQAKPLLSHRQIQVENKVKIIDPNNVTFFGSGNKVSESIFPPVASKNILHSQR